MCRLDNCHQNTKWWFSSSCVASSDYIPSGAKPGLRNSNDWQHCAGAHVLYSRLILINFSESLSVKSFMFRNHWLRLNDHSCVNELILWRSCSVCSNKNLSIGLSNESQDCHCKIRCAQTFIASKDNLILSYLIWIQCSVKRRASKELLVKREEIQIYRIIILISRWSNHSVAESISPQRNYLFLP